MPPLSSFLQKYADAYLKFDAMALLPFFDRPCMIIDGQGDHLLLSEADIVGYERPFLDTLRDMDLVSIEASPFVNQDLGSGSCFCSARYRMKSSRQQQIGDVEYHYILIGSSNNWLIKFARMGQVHQWP